LMTETAFAIATDETDGAVLYVKVGGNGDCSTWEQACELQTALRPQAVEIRFGLEQELISQLQQLIETFLLF